MPQLILPSKRIGTQTVLYDAEDTDLVNAYSWGIHTGGYVLGNLKGVGARRAKKIYMHRLILNVPKGVYVDHINAIRTDNRRANLRMVTASLNMLNQNNKRRKDNTHGFRGISLHKRSGLWQARLSMSRKRIELGYYTTPEEASAAYQKAVMGFLPAQCLNGPDLTAYQSPAPSPAQSP